MLLDVLQSAEAALREELRVLSLDSHQFHEELILERKRLEAFKDHLDRFVHHWNQLGRFEKDEVVDHSFEPWEQILDGMPTDGGHRIGASLELFECFLQKMQKNVLLAIDVRGEGNDGPKVKHPELKAFVREIRNDWVALDNAPAFGTKFELSAEHHPDKRPESAAAKLVFEAARIIDTKYSGVDCETAMRAVKSGSQSKANHK